MGLWALSLCCGSESCWLVGALLSRSGGRVWERAVDLGVALCEVFDLRDGPSGALAFLLE